MITRLEARNFRCLRHVAQPLGPLQVLIGPNASGKTSFLDALSFLGKFVAEGLEAAVVEREGSFDDLTWGRTGEPIEIAVETRKSSGSFLEDSRYEVRFGTDAKTGELAVLRERLLQALPVAEVGEPGQSLFLPRDRFVHAVFDRKASESVSFWPEYAADPQFTIPPNVRVNPGRSAYHVIEFEPLASLLVGRLFRVSLDSRALRLPSPPIKKIRRQPDGSDLPWRVQELARQPERFQQWLDHLRTALPDLCGVRTVERPEDRSAFLMAKTREGLEVPSWALSDGTLRLMALTLIAYLAEPGDVYFIEEPENGVHPANLETIFESLSSVYEGQVLLETHSPLLLGLAEPEQILCFRRTAEGTEIVRGDEHPALKDWKRDISLGSLFASGILG